jgi:hypothetical protein
LNISSTPCVSKLSAETLLPAVSSRYFSTIHGDIAGLYDSANDDWVLSFREANAALSMLAWWRDADNDYYDPYNSGGLVLDGATGSPGLAYTSWGSGAVGIFFAKP